MRCVWAHILPSVCVSVRSHGTRLGPTRHTSMKYDIFVFENLSRKLKCHWNLTKIKSTLHGDVRKFMISHWILLRMKNCSNKSCRENQNTHFMFSAPHSSAESSVFHEIMWKSMAERYWSQMTIWRLRFACWIVVTTHTHTNTHTEYVILTAFPLQQWLH